MDDARMATQSGGSQPVISDPLMAVRMADQLTTAVTDIERLQSLLNDASETLMNHFVACERLLGTETGVMPSLPELEAARSHLRVAVTAMQFPDMAMQVLTHSASRIRAVSDHLSVVEGDEVVVDFVATNCPVGQNEMEAGSVELF